ncbi:hydroxymethylbilane synthase [Salipiger aestuarii]|uniref:Porphobilinogen deaminase n=1 Tax=Salipiger aestuarii TaxID=568098 RepID=A0A327YM93_9RHOB|nr:hydroxymethylbilane synthase [Salipiger aestuarii]EIE48765.1 porphobilinogen deaminase [Citreicella sp. 357]KAA8616482.1 porphobilinogen deaminase [Salipiger aestuarii]KAB2543422.1 porphobilinogen deaminase [Salipiger aestuarii]RAK22020.1 hydroxymethylbilane synthase [Salipiger aestuarii]
MTDMLPTPDHPLKIGTRGSPLALAQAHETRARLMAAFDLPEAAFRVVVIRTSGDDRAMIAADRPLKEIGNKGLFTKEIEEQLLSGGIDIAVHSMKDMPTEQPAGLLLDCYLPREDVRDAFIAPGAAGLADLAPGTVVGTSSLRRRAQLLNRRPDLRVVEFRGNLQTRLKKLHDGVAAATFLAMAGLGRMGMTGGDVPMTPMSPGDMLPAVAQGAIGIERRINDDCTATLLAAIHHAPTALRLSAERSFLATLDGSCETPIAGLAELDGGTLRLRGEILSPDGATAWADEASGAESQGVELGAALARQLLGRAGPDFFAWRHP